MSDAPTALYNVLGVAETATPEEVKAAYHAKAKLLHPDTAGPHSDAVAFQELAAAYEVLKDPEKRAAYDRDGTVNAAPANEHKAALELVSGMMNELIAEFCRQPDLPIVDDLVEKMSQGLTERTRQIEQAVEAMRREIVRLAAFSERFSTKDGGNNVLSRIVDYRIANIEHGIERAGVDLETTLAAVGIVAGHAFKVDPIPSPLAGMANAPYRGGIGGLGFNPLAQQGGPWR